MYRNVFADPNGACKSKVNIQIGNQSKKSKLSIGSALPHIGKFANGYSLTFYTDMYTEDSDKVTTAFQYATEISIL